MATFVNNLKYPPSGITMNVFQIFLLLLKFSTITSCLFLYWLRGKSALPLLKDKVKVANSCVKKHTDLKNCGSKVVGSRRFPSPVFYGINGILWL